MKDRTAEIPCATRAEAGIWFGTETILVSDIAKRSNQEKAKGKRQKG
jgi:hypothetical protein